MRTYSNEDFIYIGKEAGNEILSKIKNAKDSVKIVSPYLSANYIQELITLHNQGRKITLITSDNLVTGDRHYSSFNISDLVKKEKIQKPEAEKKGKVILKACIPVFVLSFILLIYGFSIFAVALLFICSVFIISYFPTKSYFYDYKTIFRIKVFDSKSGSNPRSTELIHSKIFLIDDETAFLGSANFTYSGFKKHYETVIKITDKRAVKDISEEVESLYNSNIAREKSIREWSGL